MSTFKRQLTSALALNLCLKIFSFTLSTTLTRLLLPEQSGLGFSYAIYTDTALFLAREAVRNVAVRQPLEDPPASPADDAETNSPALRAKSKRTPESTSAALARGAAVRAVLYLGFLAVPLGLAVMLLMEAQSFVGLSLFPCLLRDVYPTTLLSIYDFMPFLSGSASRAWGPLFSSCLMHIQQVLVWSSVTVTLLAEPCVVLAQCLGCFSRVVVSEFVSLVARLAVTIFFVWYSPLLDKWETQLFFAFGYMAASIAHLLYWLWTCRRRRQPRTGDVLQGAVAVSFLLPSRHSGLPGPARAVGDIGAGRLVLPFPFHCFAAPALAHAGREHSALLRTFGQESVLRVVLSEGEKFTLTVFGSSTARGHYEMITHLGSLVARLVFRVWENACGVRWSQLVANEQAAEAVQLLAVMLRLALGVGMTFPLLGPPLAAHFLTALYSARWSSPAMVRALQWFCVVVPCMAVNGLLEAFLRATATPLTLRRLQTCMVTESIVYMLACYTVLGTSVAARLSVEPGSIVPLVCLNLGNMLCRIARSVLLILLDSRTPPPRHSSEGKAAVAVVVPATVFTGIMRPAFAAAVVVLFAVTRVVDSVVVALMAGVLYPVLLLTLDPEVQQMAQRLVRRRHDAPASNTEPGTGAAAVQKKQA